MKKKLPVAVLAITAAVYCAFGFAACNDRTDDGADGGSEQTKEVYGSEGLEYTLSEDGSYYCFTGLGTCTQTEIVIANYYNGKPVKQIGKYNFLTEDEAPDEVTEAIESEDYDWLLIFEGSEVKSVTVSYGITVIGALAFSFRDNTGNLEFVSLPASITTICAGAFIRCSGLTSIDIPDTVTEIGEGVFQGCTGLKRIDIPVGVTEIREWMFLDCAELQEINFGGTKAQWNAMEKGIYWAAGTGDFTVHCSDGDI